METGNGSDDLTIFFGINNINENGSRNGSDDLMIFVAQIIKDSLNTTSYDEKTGISAKVETGNGSHDLTIFLA